MTIFSNDAFQGNSFINRRSHGLLTLGLMTLWMAQPSGLIAQTSAPSPTLADPIALYRSANEALADKEYMLASQGFEQVARLTSGSPLALEAGYFDLIAKRHRIASEPSTQNCEELANSCSHWMCSAKAWMHSTPKQEVAHYSSKLAQRIAWVLTLETQLAFASGRWLETLVLLDQLPHHASDSQEAIIESSMMRLECCVQLQRWSDAQESTESLQIIAEEKLAQTPPPSWLEKYLLRKAEVAMVLGKWKDAESDVWKIRTHFPECKVSSQVDYVLARCLVNDAKFEEARQLLASVLATQPPPAAPLQTKVWWTIAESHLMQRNFPDAIAAYEQVAKLGADSPWSALAQRQLAICQQAYGSTVASGSEPNAGNSLRSTQKQTPKQPR